MEAVKQLNKKGKEDGVKPLMLASIGVAYDTDKILWDNLGGNKLTFMRYHQEFQKAYTELAKELTETFGVNVAVGRYGLEINYYGKDYIYSKDYVTGQNVVSGEDSVFANYLVQKVNIDNKRVVGRYLTKGESEEVLRVAVEQFIILPTDIEMRLKEKLVTLSLTRPKDWIQEMQGLTERLGLEKPQMHMEKDGIVIQRSLKSKMRIEWKFDKESVKSLVNGMCKFWEKDKKSNRKPDNKVVRGGGITLVNLTQEQKDYREYISKQVKDALSKAKNVSDLYKITYSNTTTSCYVDFTDSELYDLKISIRDHEDMHENGYYRFYIDAVGREDFSKRLAMVVDELVKVRKDK